MGASYLDTEGMVCKAMFGARINIFIRWQENKQNNLLLKHAATEM